LVIYKNWTEMHGQQNIELRRISVKNGNPEHGSDRFNIAAHEYWNYELQWQLRTHIRFMILRINYSFQGCKLKPSWRQVPQQLQSQAFKTAAPLEHKPTHPDCKAFLGLLPTPLDHSLPHTISDVNVFQTSFNVIVNFWGCRASEMDVWAWGTGGIMLTGVNRSTNSGFTTLETRYCSFYPLCCFSYMHVVLICTVVVLYCSVVCVCVCASASARACVYEWVL